MKVKGGYRKKRDVKKKRGGTMNKWRFNGHNNKLILGLFLFFSLKIEENIETIENSIIFGMQADGVKCTSRLWHISDTPICNLKTQVAIILE